MKEKSREHIRAIGKSESATFHSGSLIPCFPAPSMTCHGCSHAAEEFSGLEFSSKNLSMLTSDYCTTVLPSARRRRVSLSIPVAWDSYLFSQAELRTVSCCL
jgi:hypothetical protein